ncbi:hypothetical protein EWB00_008643 [Schistosoma japonicum]|uniref:Uncharacterized protein n=1 Tax=Schistosoma japonicum TaxID=6182 RepID=A0A4Z2CPG4_SCHJA|nr:hypothetical protein EWB00_008643 [Schistosoma japonicum]
MSSKDNRLERALSESTNVMVTKESKTPETCQSTITLHNRLFEKQDNDYMKSLQYFEQSIQNTHRPPVIDYNHQHSHYDNIKCKEEFIDTWDTSWDSESDLVNISEITEISVNSINEKSLNCSYNGLNHSNEYTISVDNLKMNGHDVDNDEPDSCLI